MRTLTKTNGGRIRNWNRIIVEGWWAVVKGVALQYTAEETWNVDEIGIGCEDGKLKVCRARGPFACAARIQTHPSTHPYLERFSLHTFINLSSQVFGRKGAKNVKGECGVKAGHVSAMFAVPAKGKMASIVWTFAGTDKRSRIAGTTSSYFNCTENGWPDEVSWVLWCRMFVSELKERGLTKALLYCDNASLHYNRAGRAILAEANVRLVGLIPSCTGWMQPLDVSYFGQLKTALQYVKGSARLTDGNVAAWVEATVKHLAGGNIGAPPEKRIGKMKAPRPDPGASGFKRSGLFPFDVEVFPDESFRATDVVYGLSKDHPKVRAAAKLTPEAVGVVVDSIRARMRPSMIAKERAEGEADMAKRGFDIVRRAFMNDATAAARQEEEKAAAKKEKDEKEAKAAERAQRAADNKAAAAARSAAWKAKCEEAAAKRQAAVEAKAAPPAEPSRKRRARPVTDPAEDSRVGGGDGESPYAVPRLNLRKKPRKGSAAGAGSAVRVHLCGGLPPASSPLKFG